MDFGFSEEQDEFRETVRRFLEEKSPSAEVRALMESEPGYDPVVWKQMAGELGLQGLQIPEAYGGQGFGALELGMVLEEMGRVLYCGPYFSTTCLAAGAILRAGGEEQKQALLPGLASGETIATLALLEEGSDWGPGATGMVARRDGEAFRLDGVKTPVTDGHLADLILVVARLEGTAGDRGVGVFLVPSGVEGVSSVPLETLDLTRRQARVELENVRAEALGEPGGTAGAVQRTLDQAAALLAAESVGGAARCLEAAVEYAGSRIQFGRPIGSFQAIKHKCADLLLEVESARSAVHWATWVAAEDGPDLAQAASVAKALGNDAYLLASAENIQIHGGIGITWEADPQLYFKRAKTNEVLLGDSVYHRTRLIQQMGV